ncbi:MAG: truncated hemoglobin [Oligoflexales bacterium]
MKNLYEKIGSKKLEDIIRHFYDNAFEDVMIGYFFTGKDKEKLIRHQIEFTSQLLGCTDINYQGQPLPQVHNKLAGLRKPHFDRRHLLLKEAMSAFQLPNEITEEWLTLERRLLPLILGRRTPTKQ